MRPSRLLCAALCATAFGAGAQLATPNPDWREIEAPLPPAFEISRLIPFDVSASSSLRYGVDPATISLGSDGIVRYVMVAQSATGALNALYEGIKCNTGEFKTYGRYNPAGGWNRVDSPEWKSLWATEVSKHTLRFARQGGCAGNAPPTTVEQMVRDLKNQDYQKLR